MNTRAILITTLLTLLALTPVVSLAYTSPSGLIFCNTELNTDTGQFKDPCTFNSAVQLVQAIINFIIKAATILAAVSFIYAGFLLITDGGSLANVKKAKSILWATVKGFALILCAWLIVYTIINTLVKPDAMTSLLSP